MGFAEHDAVIVGGGHNGLACAAYLAKAGLDVLVLERRDVLGGAAVTEEPWPGYRVSSASYVVSLMPPRIVDELELKRFGYEVSIVSPDYFVPFPDGTSLTLWGDLPRDRANIGRLSPHDADAYAAFDAYFERIAGLLRDLLFVVPPNMRLAEAPRWVQTVGRFRGWSGRDLHELVRLFTMSAADFLDEWFEDERVKGALATQAIIGAWCGPMTPGSAYVLMHHWIGEIDGHFGAWGWVKGGMGGVSMAMARAAEAAGATIRTDTPVARVAINSQGRAVGVELEDGSLIRAKTVVSNAHPTTTYLDLVGEERLPADVVRDVRRYRTRSGSVKINVALSELPAYPSWDQEGDVHRGLMAVSPSMEYLERAFDDAKYGRASRHPYAEVMFPTAHEEGLAPDGKHLMLAFTQYGPIELREGSWETERDAYAKRVVDELARYAPGLPDAIEHLEVLTPRDLEDRYGLLGGNIMQGELTPDQMFSFRPIPFYGDHRTPIAGLYLCGGGTHPGGGVMGVPGRNASTVVVRDLRGGALTRRVRSSLTRSMTLQELAGAVRSRAVTAVELVSMALERIDRLDPTLNAVISTCPDAAMDTARAQDVRIAAGEDPGPIAGLPLLVKDMEDVAGLPSTFGSVVFGDAAPAATDALVPRRLRAAGAIVIGKTNQPEFAFAGYTTNTLYGTTVNPWGTAWSPGGSSGGSGAALAAGMAAIATATDGGGSIRIPAAFCGLAGLKPTNGVIARDPIPAWIDLSTCGPLATSMADIRLLLSLEMGPEPGDPSALPLALPMRPDLPRRVLATPRFEDLGPLPPDVAERFASALDHLERDLGLPVEPVEPGGVFSFDRIDADWYTICAFEHLHLLGRTFVEEQMERFSPDFQDVMRHALRIRAEGYMTARRRRFQLVRDLDVLLGADAVLVTPTMGVPGLRPDGRGPDGEEVEHGGSVYNTDPLNMTGHPALSLPAGVCRNGIPFGLQIAGPRFRDDLVLNVGDAWESANPWPLAAPGYEPFAI